MSTRNILNSQKEITDLRKKLDAFLEEYLSKKIEDIDRSYLDTISRKNDSFDETAKAIENNLQREKDRTWIFFEMSTDKNKEIDTEIARINLIKADVLAVRNFVEKINESNIERPTRIEAAGRDIKDRLERRKSELMAHAVKGTNIRKRAQDNFTRAFTTEPLDRAGANELITTERDLDKLKIKGATASIFDKGTKQLSDLAEDITGTAKVVSAETFFTAGKTLALLFAWPVILPMKAVNFVSDLVSRGFRATEAFFQTFNDYAHKSADNSKGLANVGWNIVRGVTGVITLASAGIKGATRLVANLFDTDNMLKKGNMGAAFGMGWIGAALLISLAVASVFTLGIPIAMVAVGAAFAAVIGVAKIGMEYSKFSEKRTARRNFRLTSEEETQLLEYAERNNAQDLVTQSPLIDMKPTITRPRAQAVVEPDQNSIKRSLSEAQLKFASLDEDKKDIEESRLGSKATLTKRKTIVMKDQAKNVSIEQHEQFSRKHTDTNKGPDALDPNKKHGKSKPKTE